MAQILESGTSLKYTHDSHVSAELKKKNISVLSTAFMMEFDERALKVEIKTRSGVTENVGIPTVPVLKGFILHHVNHQTILIGRNKRLLIAKIKIFKTLIVAHCKFQFEQ